MLTTLRNYATKRMPKRFRRDESGVVAVEFAIVAMPFFALMFMILETALSFFTQQMLETSTADAARLIMTGQVKASAMTAGQFKTKVCDGLPLMFDCNSECQVDVRRVDAFDSSIDAAMSGGIITFGGSAKWEIGAGGDIVITRVACALPVYTNFFGAYLTSNKLASGKMLQMATSARRNEPFL